MDTNSQRFDLRRGGPPRRSPSAGRAGNRRRGTLKQRLSQPLRALGVGISRRRGRPRRRGRARRRAEFAALPARTLDDIGVLHRSAVAVVGATGAGLRIKGQPPSGTPVRRYRYVTVRRSSSAHDQFTRQVLVRME